jgi:branched-chain amino acid transport system ATP-binding protein
MKEAIRIDGLSKHFGGVAAVDNVSFGVSVGEHLVIIGPNGAGKTTLFNLVNGQLVPTSGRIYFFGRDVTTLATHVRAKIGMARAFQIISLMMGLTVLDNALLTSHGIGPHVFQTWRPVMGYDQLREKVRETLEALNLWDRRDVLVKNLSHGDQRRLEIGLGLAVQPRLLLLDEPSAGLTKEEGMEVISIIKNLGSDITVLMVDHDMEMVFEVAERIIVLHYGQIIADGTPKEIQADQRVREIYMGLAEGGDHARAS